MASQLATRGRPAITLVATDGDSAMREAMQRVAARLEQRCGGAGPFRDVVRHVLARPGKGIRGRLLLACAGLERMPNAMGPDAIDAAAAIELLHEASLVHDDICDAASTRRGAASVVAAFGMRTAGLAGAFLAGHALGLLGDVLARRGRPAELTRLTALVEGQMLESVPPPVSLRDARRRYERVVNGKTGALFRFACEVGVLLTRLPPSVGERVDVFARNLALAFQVLDDVRDLEEPADLGKPAAKDLDCGIVTWPVLAWLERESEPTASLRRVTRVPKTVAETEALRRTIRDCGATERARDFARGCLAAAREVLDAVPPGWGRQALDAVVVRVGQQ